MSASNHKVSIAVGELLLEIKNATYLASSAKMAGGTGYEQATEMQATGDPSPMLKIRRTLAEAFARVKKELDEWLVPQECTSDEDAETALKNVNGDETLELAFALPANFNEGAADSIGAGVRKYLESMATGEWYAIVSKDEAETCLQQAAAAMQEAKQATMERKRPARPTYE